MPRKLTSARAHGGPELTKRTHGGYTQGRHKRRTQGGQGLEAWPGGHKADTWRTSSGDAARAYRSKREPHSKLFGEKSLLSSLYDVIWSSWGVDGCYGLSMVSIRGVLDGFSMESSMVLGFPWGFSMIFLEDLLLFEVFFLAHFKGPGISRCPSFVGAASSG